ncbi:TPA: hypothetical protein DDW35_01430 [Candidatus Sumerlaeota bacterium]|jgi:magnesium transporter|nr:hypothetical protein [Candidatus Sumerlaeota bacterium]
MAQSHSIPPASVSSKGEAYRLLFFSDLYKLPVCIGTVKQRLGKLTDLVFRQAEPYPEAVGLYLEHGWGKPTEFIPWEKVIKIDQDSIFVAPPPNGEVYPPFVDQKGWILVDAHLMGRTILDMDGRRTEVVNDVHFLETRGKLHIAHVDVSFNGFLRRWGIRNLRWIKDRLISWKYVQPLSVEDVVKNDVVSLSVTREDVKELPGEDLADILEELSGEEQQALFAALDSEKAAETLVEAEPRAQRQLVANLRREKARHILSEMSVPQLADLFSVLPHDDLIEMMELLPKDQSDRVQAILNEREATARALMTSEYVSARPNATVGEVMGSLRQPDREPRCVSYVYVLKDDGKTLEGVVDLRELVLEAPEKKLEDIMTSPAVTVEEDMIREELGELFEKYRFRSLPVVDANDKLLGVVHYNDIV